jgi:hypothetical protein
MINVFNMGNVVNVPIQTKIPRSKDNCASWEGPCNNDKKKDQHFCITQDLEVEWLVTLSIMGAF